MTSNLCFDMRYVKSSLLVQYFVHHLTQKSILWAFCFGLEDKFLNYCDCGWERGGMENIIARGNMNSCMIIPDLCWQVLWFAWLSLEKRGNMRCFFTRTLPPPPGKNPGFRIGTHDLHLVLFHMQQLISATILNKINRTMIKVFLNKWYKKSCNI